jgi:hypothetical protein
MLELDNNTSRSKSPFESLAGSVFEWENKKALGLADPVSRSSCSLGRRWVQKIQRFDLEVFAGSTRWVKIQ